ncbi:MAG: biotin/lipoyl-binding protein [Chloroflexota bacterium]|nr:biotin/lipoyl-binding protein [Chloroflexota bacterium]
MSVGVPSLRGRPVTPPRAGWTGALFGTWKGRIALLVLVAMMAGAVVYRSATAPTAPGYRTVAAQRGDVAQLVRITGTVDPATDTRVVFKIPGRLAETLVTVGQSVTAGQTLARLDASDLQLALAQAKAGLAAAQAKYDLTVAGARPEDVAAAQQAVDSAKSQLDATRASTAADLASAQQSLATLRTAYASAQNGFQLLGTGIPDDTTTLTSGVGSARSILAQAFVDFTTMSTADITVAKTTLGQADASLGNAQNVAQGQLADALTQWTSARDGAIAAWLQFDGAVQRGTDTSGPSAAYQSAQLTYTTATSRLQAALTVVSTDVTTAQANATLAQNALGSSTSRIDASLDRVRADIAGLQTSLAAQAQLAATLTSKLGQMTASLAVVGDAVGGSYVTAQQAVASAQAKIVSAVQSAQSVYDSALSALTRTSAPARSYDIAAAQAGVVAQQAVVDKAASDLASATLAAPVAGVVAQINGEPGEQLVGGTSAAPFIVLSNTSTITLHGSAGEADVAKLKLGQAATVTIDAVGRTTRFDGRVTRIDPVATLQQGVPVYGVEVTIDGAKEGLRAGMVGTASVVIASKKDVLLVPTSAIRDVEGGRGVQILRDGALTAVPATFGIAGDTLTEVSSGVREGDLVVVPEPGATVSSGIEVTALGPFAYAAPIDPAIGRVAIVVRVTNTSEDDLTVSPSDFVARDADHRVYAANAQAGVADARLVRAAVPQASLPLVGMTLRKNDVLAGFVVFDVPAGVRPTQLVYRQTDADHVVDLAAR